MNNNSTEGYLTHVEMFGVTYWLVISLMSTKSDRGLPLNFTMMIRWNEMMVKPNPRAFAKPACEQRINIKPEKLAQVKSTNKSFNYEFPGKIFPGWSVLWQPDRYDGHIKSVDHRHYSSGLTAF